MFFVCSSLIDKTNKEQSFLITYLLRNYCGKKYNKNYYNGLFWPPATSLKNHRWVYRREMIKFVPKIIWQKYYSTHCSYSSGNDCKRSIKNYCTRLFRQSDQDLTVQIACALFIYGVHSCDTIDINIACQTWGDVEALNLRAFIYGQWAQKTKEWVTMFICSPR
jgi:hypothetical protein